MNEPLRAISVFSGAGGSDLGYTWAGLKVIAACDQLHEAAQSYRFNFPEAEVIEAPVGDVDWSRFRGVDLVVGSPPCQPFSGAGKHGGEFDPRDGFPVALGVIAQVQPRAFVWENVRGLLSKKHSIYLHKVMESHRALGYRVETRLLNAVDFGVPQNRYRCFMVGFRLDQLGRFGWPVPTHVGRHRRRQTEPLFGEHHRTVRQALNLGTAQQEPLPDQRPRGDLPQRSRPLQLDEPAPTRGASSGGQEKVPDPVLRRHRGRSQERPDSTLDEPSPAVLADAPSGRSGLHLVDRQASDATLARHPGMDPDEPSAAIRSGGDGHSNPHQYLLDHQPRGAARAELDEPSPTVIAGGNPAGGGAPPYLMVGGYQGVLEVPHEAIIDDPDRPAPTIRAGGGAKASGGQHGGNPPYLAVRRDEGAGSPGLSVPDRSVDEAAPAVRAGGMGGLKLAMANGLGRADPVDLDQPARAVLARTSRDNPDLTREVKVKESQSQRLLDLDQPARTVDAGGQGGPDIRVPAPASQSQRLFGADEPAPSIQVAKGTAPRVSPELPIMDGPSTTVTSRNEMSLPGHHDPDQRGSSGQFTSKAGVRYRRLTWQECAALQAFPPGYIFTGTDTKRYLLIGNAVPPPLAQVVGEALIEALR